MDKKLLRDIMRRHRRAKRARPDIPDGDMLFSIFGDEHVETIAEHNASGEPTYFVCLRVATANPADIVHGSTRLTCTRCGAKVWISPGTRATYNRIPKAEIICEECFRLMPPEEAKPP
jgi:hypothetical protein